MVSKCNEILSKLKFCEFKLKETKNDETIKQYIPALSEAVMLLLVEVIL